MNGDEDWSYLVDGSLDMVVRWIETSWYLVAEDGDGCS
jgi:hypothetical protein